MKTVTSCSFKKKFEPIFLSDETPNSTLKWGLIIVAETTFRFSIAYTLQFCLLTNSFNWKWVSSLIINYRVSQNHRTGLNKVQRFGHVYCFILNPPRLFHKILIHILGRFAETNTWILKTTFLKCFNVVCKLDCVLCILLEFCT